MVKAEKIAGLSQLATKMAKEAVNSGMPITVHLFMYLFQLFSLSGFRCTYLKKSNVGDN